MSWVLNEEVLAVLAAIVLVAAVLAGVQVLNAGRVVEPFSELGLLGPEGKIGSYPKRGYGRITIHPQSLCWKP